MIRFYRPFLKEDGKTYMVAVPICSCENRRGPKGGVCGCGNAIPSDREQHYLDYDTPLKEQVFNLVSFDLAVEDFRRARG